MGVKIITFGCRLNTYESEVLRKELTDIDIAENIIIFNSCAVTNEAERQLKQSIRKARRENEDSKIVLTGCAAQIYPEKYAVMDEVDLVAGNKEKSEFVKVLKEYLCDSSNKTNKVSVSNIYENSDYFRKFSTLTEFGDRTRAFVQVQNGCNHYCTYCIIPYGRGKSTSISSEQVLSQIKELVDSGYKEIVITGVDITEYGEDLHEGLSLTGLVKLVLRKFPKLERLRLSSIDVAEIDEELMSLICYEKRLMPHIHISLQSGDNIILKRMMRRHTREDVIEFCNKIRSIRPEIAFGCDIIAGFPTETDEMFQNSLKIIDEAGLVYTHIFPYSAREGTPAAKMRQVRGNIIKQRAKLLREAGEKQLIKFLDKMVGTQQKILIEKNNEGKTENFVQVKIDSKKNLKSGDIIYTSIIGRESNKLLAVY